MDCSFTKKDGIKMHALVLHINDNVATTVCELKKKEAITIMFPDGDKRNIKTINNIPAFHKLALKNISNGDIIFKYGYPMGRSTKNIVKGEHVHSHNMVSEQEEK